MQKTNIYKSSKTLRFITIIFSVFQFSFSYSQVYDGQIISKSNDTTTVKILIKGDMIFKNNKILSLQKKVTVLTNTTEKDYFPKDLKSFKIRMNDKVKVYDNVNDLEFAERMYANKLKLYYKLVWQETKISPYFIIFRVFMVLKPNGEIKNIIPNGLSRLITQDEMLAKFTDCKISLDKIKNDEMKIRNEEKLVEFIADYEKNCFE
ncbi:MAG: hypothetical protein H7339_17240 [Arcicella sp.]|nr:hypothetical protein [Arcicella sp.]